MSYTYALIGENSSVKQFKDCVLNAIRDAEHDEPKLLQLTAQQLADELNIKRGSPREVVSFDFEIGEIFFLGNQILVNGRATINDAQQYIQIVATRDSVQFEIHE